MADPRYRYPTDLRGEPPKSATLRAPRAEDPLAELARMIGQEDPFKDFNKDDGFGAQAAPAPARTYSREPAARESSLRESLTREPAAPDARYGAQPSTRSAAIGDSRFATARETRFGVSGEPSTIAPDPRAAFPAVRQPAYDQPSPARQPAAGRNSYAPEPQPAPPPAANAGEDRYRRYAEPDDAERDFDRDYAEPEPENDPYYSDDGHMSPHGEDVFEEQPKRRGRTGLVVVGAVIGLAVLGTGAVFGYRAIMGGGGKPPTIRADAGPNKVAPSSSQESGGQKLIYDRVGGAPGGAERVVSREEQPVDVSRSAPPSGDPQSPNEPRKVRTLTVRSDGTVVAPPPAPTPTASAGVPGQTRIAPGGGAALPTVRPAVPVAPAPAGQPPTSPPPAVAPSASQPLALQPTGRPQPAAPVAVAPAPAPGSQAQQPSNTRVAVAPPAPPPSAPARSAAASGGGFFVQVSAQRSEGEAQAALRSMQSRYSNVLGGQPTTVRRADLGERGTFYRALIGPVGSREQANDLCSSLKSAGGDCVVQRN